MLRNDELVTLQTMEALKCKTILFIVITLVCSDPDNTKFQSIHYNLYFVYFSVVFRGHYISGITVGWETQSLIPLI